MRRVRRSSSIFVATTSLFDEKTLSVAVADLERELNQPIVTLKQPQVWKELQELFRQRLDELRKESSEGEETHHG